MGPTSSQVTPSGLPVEDPLPQLSPTAARLLEAAKRIVARDGVTRLTFEAVAAESGENGSLIRYHFGSKAGLVGALVDSIIHQGSAELLAALRAARPGDERRAALLATQRRWIEDPDEYRTFYAMLSHALFDESLRDKYSALFDWYVNLEAWALSDADEAEGRRAAEPLAALIIAATDGLGLQRQARSEFDAGPVVDVLEEMVALYLEKHGVPRPEGDR